MKFTKGTPCEAAGPNHPENANKYCTYEEPHDHGGFDCDKTCPCRMPDVPPRPEPMVKISVG